MIRRHLAITILMAVALATLSACPGGPGPGATPTPATATPAVAYSLPELKYRLISNFGDVFFCDPDLYPVARVGQEERNALVQFGAIQADDAEFSPILKQLRLANKADYTTEEKVLVYREHKKLTFAVEMAASGDGYRFTLRVGQGQGERIQGIVTPSGQITIQKREPSFNTCPICLAAGTLIDTPGGPVPVEQIREGMLVWTLDDSGTRVAAPVVKTAATHVPPSFLVARVRLNDGRAVTASPGHPTAEGKALGDYTAGDILDGAVVAGVDYVAYDSDATYDLLPASPRGVYWANGIILKSTLARIK